MFYLFFPLACLLLAGKRFFGRSIVFPTILFVFVILGPFGRTLFASGKIAEDYSYLGGMQGISLGCVTALAVSSRRFSRRAIRFLGIVGTVVVSASLIFSWQVYRDRLGKTGLNFTLLGVGTCMFIAAKPMRGMPILFAFTILVAAVLGAGVANLHSEPANHFLRNKTSNPVGNGASIALTSTEEATVTSSGS